MITTRNHLGQYQVLYSIGCYKCCTKYYSTEQEAIQAATVEKERKQSLYRSSVDLMQPRGI